MFAASWAFMLSGWRINEKDLPLKILNFGGFQQIKRRNPFGIWITPYYAEDSISDSAHHRKPLLLACTWISNDKKQNRYFPGPDSGRQAAMVWLQRWNQLKKKNRIRSSKYFPLLDRRRGGDCGFRGWATRGRTQGHKNHRAPKKMLREKNSRWWEFWQEARLRRGWFPTGSFFYRSQILRQIAPFLWIQRHTTENLWVITWKTAIILSFNVGIYHFFSHL